VGRNLLTGNTVTSAGISASPGIAVLGDLPLEVPDLQRLASHGKLTVWPRVPLTIADTLPCVADNEIIIIGATPIGEELLCRAPNLRLIDICSAGYDHVDVAAATKRGVTVCNVPGYAAVSVAEQAIALALAVAKRLPQGDRLVRAGEWVDLDYTLTQLAGRTFGVLGTGAVGSRVAKLARAFGCQVLAYDLVVSPELAADSGVEYVALDHLLRDSDFVCLCLTLNPSTERLVGAHEFALMTRKPILINVARGRLIDQAALLQALRQGQICGAGLDVLEVEPAPAGEPLLAEENVVLSPHVGAHTPETNARLSRICVDNVASFLQGAPQNVAMPAD